MHPVANGHGDRKHRAATTCRAVGKPIDMTTRQDVRSAAARRRDVLTPEGEPTAARAGQTLLQGSELQHKPTSIGVTVPTERHCMVRR
jgi:hypothetical protein